MFINLFQVFMCYFYVSGVAAYVGWQSSSILKPLLQQGLSDAEEFVIYKALNALTCMCQLGLLQKPHIYEFACDIGKLEYWTLPYFLKQGKGKKSQYYIRVHCQLSCPG